MERSTPLAVVAMIVAVGAQAGAQVTERVSVDSSGAQSSFRDWSDHPSISRDGRYVAFQSIASNLVAGDTNGYMDVFVHDRRTGTTIRASVDSAGNQANYDSLHPVISADGQLVAFGSDTTDLVPDHNDARDVFVHDLRTGVTERVSISTSGAEANDWSDYVSDNEKGTISISADGSIVAFTSWASNLDAGDVNILPDVFVRDRNAGTTERVSLPVGGIEHSDWCFDSGLSADGRFVAFATSYAVGVPLQIYLRDRQVGTMECISVNAGGAPCSGECRNPSLSSDGQYVVFESDATDLVAGDANGLRDIFVRDRATGVTELASVSTSGVQGDQASWIPAISGDGRFVSFESASSSLVLGVGWGAGNQVYLRDRLLGVTTIASVSSSGQRGAGNSTLNSISQDGRFVAFGSNAINLVANDTNQACDIFVHGPYLTLEADPPQVAAGATLTFTTWTGDASNLALLVLIDIDGVPLFLPAALSTFDASGVWSLSATVPSDLSGSVLTLQTYGFVPTGKVQASNAVAVTFH
jgi:Tol biopolymer transport system component